MKKILLAGLLTAVTLSLSACGGGGSGGTVTLPAPTTAVLKLSTVAKAGQAPQAAGLELTVLLPAGVTVKTVTASKQTASGVLNYSGNVAFSNITTQLFPRPLFGLYSASAVASGKNAVKIQIASGSATFGAGEFATLTCNIGAGTSVTATDFHLTGFLAGGSGGTDITAQFDSPTFTASFK
ncbi:hypothetical protein [Geomonas sp.]|uniref:hypothetical protein n=1 Tax=Geomonas sp. TaxID=2651584 RepID=UPI002B467993|nr:hypothetical protein [Geomonas sp.]HJV35615.1 hypothetical protein [Geomonas sp.]